MIFDECIKLYAAYDPESAEKITSADLTGYELYPTHLGEDNLVINGKHFLHAAESAAKEAESWFQSLKLSGIDLIYIYGIGMGHYFDALKKWLAEDKRRFVVFLETDLAVLHRLFETKRGLEILKHDNVLIQTISIVNNRVDISLNKRFNTIFAAFYHKNPLLTSLKAYQDRGESVLLGIKSQLYISLSWQRILHTDKEGLLRKVTGNIIENILQIEDSVLFSDLEEKFDRVPAIIAGAGPSIMKEIEFLKESKQKCLLIGSGTGTNVLNRNGIFPHFFMGLDPTETQEVRVRMNNSYTIPCFHKFRFSSVASKMLSGERVLIRGTESPFPTTWFEKELGIAITNEIDTGISSTTFAIAIAEALGCNPIILVGLDLAYTENKRYPDSVSSMGFGHKNLQDEIQTKAKNLLVGKGYHNEEVLTKMDWLIESSLISQFQGKHRHTKIYNATQGGLKIDSVENRPLKELLNELPLLDDLGARLHAFMHDKPPKLLKNPREVVDLWESYVVSFLEDLEEFHLSGSLDYEEFIENEKNPFFESFLPGYRELQDGYLFLGETLMKKNQVLGNEYSSQEILNIFYTFWKETAEHHLEGIRDRKKR